MSRILIADDVAENRYMLLTLFRSRGYDVEAAENGALALQMALKSPPDVIVTDILMPVMDGFELCRRWRIEPTLKEIPFVFYTATYTDEKDERFALSLGAWRFLVKPQRAEVLMSAVQEVLEEARLASPATAAKPLGEEMEVLRQYNDTLFRKLESKVSQLASEVRERRRSELALMDAQAQLLAAHRLAHIGVWSWDAKTDDVIWSEELYRFFGLDPARPAPRFADQSRFYAPTSWALLSEAVSEAVETGKSYELELECRRADGATRWGLASGGVKRDGRGKMVGLYGTVLDIDRRKRAELERQELEERLIQAQKMEAVGRLAGGVAHDFNNLLFVILNCTAFALDQLPSDSPVQADLLQVLKAGERATALTRHLLAFCSKQVMEPQIVDLRDVVTDLGEILKRGIGERIDLALQCESSLPPVVADPGQLAQVIMNLVLNARDAMPEGGRITVKTALLKVGKGQAGRYGDLRPGTYVELTVADTGCGMDPVTMNRMFEPFFTTKESGKGTGLGLATVYGIVKQTGGAVWADSQLGQGSCFHVAVPVHQGTQPAVPEPKSIPTPSPRGRETILVVEDDPAVLDVAVTMLRASGFQVLTATSGEEALKLYTHHPGEIHLVLTDVVMPQLSGNQLADYIRARNPGQRILYMSGYVDEAIASRSQQEPGTLVLAKPFTSAVLLTKIREALDLKVS